MDAATTSSSFPGTSSSFLILSVSIAGIVAISLLLLAYCLFLTRCGLLFFQSSSISASSVTTLQVQSRIRSAGLEEAAIRRIPTFRYCSRSRAAASSSECAVCLADFRDGERLRLLPPCLHAFHIDCIDAWLQATANCPLCRAAVVPPRTTHDVLVVIDLIPTSPPAADDEADQPAAVAPSSSNCRSSSLLPMRRSLSMDSCADKRFYLALQRMLQQNQGSPAATGEEEGGKNRSSRRLRRSFFSFSSQSRGSRSIAVLPL